MSTRRKVPAKAMLPMRGAKPVTLGDWLNFAEKIYAREKVALGQVATNAHDEALYLLLTVLGLPLDSEAGGVGEEVDGGGARQGGGNIAPTGDGAGAGGVSHAGGVAGGISVLRR